MKKLGILFTVIFILMPCTAFANDAITEQYNATGLAGVYDITSEVFPEFSAENIVKSLSKGEGISPESVIKRIAVFLFDEFIAAFKISAVIVVVGVIVAIINNVQESFSGKGAAGAASVISYCVFAGVLTAGFSQVTLPATDTIDALCVMIKSSIPVLVSMTVMSGGAFSGSFMMGLLMSMVNVVGTVMQNIVLPLALSSVSLSVAGNMGNKINISSLTQSVRKFAKWLMIFCMAVYSGFFGVYGLAGASLDSAFGKAARFAIGSGIPIVGGVVADSIETVMGTLGAVKNITGTVGIIVIVLTALSPVLKTVASMWMLRICSAVLQPISGAGITSLVSDVADSMGIVLACLMCVCLLFCASVGILLLTGGAVS